MKKNFKTTILLATALLFGLSSCNNNDTPYNGDYNETGKVQFHLILPETRLEGPTQAENPVAIVRGTLLFTNNAGIIQHVFTIGNNATTYDVLLTDVASSGGHLFTNINATARVVHFIGNTTVIPVVGTNISTVLNGVLCVLTQAGNITAGTEQVVNVYGAGTMIAPGTPGNPWTAVVNVEPTVGRIELHHITGDHTIAGFTVNGIFMDRYFEEACIDGRLIGNPILRGQGALTNAQYSALFNVPSTHPTDVTQIFTEPMRGAIFDWHESGWVSAPVKSSTFVGYVQGTRPVNATYVWGYNLFADYSNVARTQGSQFPHTVIRLSNVTVNARVYRWVYEAGYGPANDPDTNNATYTHPYVGGEWVFDRIEVQPHPLHNHNAGVNQVPHLFLTIRGFIHNGVVIDRNNGFLPRRVYQIGVDAGDGWFGVDDIFLVPNIQPIDVNVEVVRMRWINLSGRPVI